MISGILLAEVLPGREEQRGLAGYGQYRTLEDTISLYGRY